MILLLATQNAGKVREFQSLLEPIFTCEPADSRAPHVVEDGKTYQENALKKVRAYYQVYQRPLLVDDSGLEIDGLGGGPGVDSAVFGGEKISWPERWELIHKTLTSLPPEAWNARFRCLLCYFDGKSEPLFFEGTCEGKILATPTGGKGFGYDPIFYSFDLKKGFGEASNAEKAAVSHRARASRKFLAWASHLS